MLAMRLSGSAARMSRTTRAESASPASTTVSAASSAMPFASTCENADGTALTRLAVIGRSASATTSRTTSMVPPTVSGQKISKTDTSKFSDVDATTRDRPAAPNAEAAQPMSATMFSCVTTTPFGRPVDPDV